MDSHLIAGAYSQKFLALKDDDTLVNSDRLDAIARAKRLSQETNRRRKLQASKRKLQAKREEKRRHDILTRRREEQRQATEKYQRSHLPPSARQSYRFVQRKSDGPALDEALQLIRGVPHYHRYMSSLERILSDTNENKDPLEVSFNKPRPYSSQPGSGRLTQQLNSKTRAELLNYSKQNMTASKTLFEQMLEQQQSHLLEQQQQSLHEFSQALHYEIDGEKTFEKTANDNSAESDDQDSEENITNSNSCSSLDSLEESNVSDIEMTKLNDPRHALTPLRQRPVSAFPVTGQNINQNKIISAQHQQPELQLQQQRLKNMTLLNEQKSYPLDQNRSSYIAYKKNESFTEIPKTETRLTSENVNYYHSTGQQHSISHNGLTSNGGIQHKETVVNGNGKFTIEQECQIPLKQMSTDSLECSSSVINTLVHQLKGVAEENSIDNGRLQSEGTEGGNRVHISNVKSKMNTEINNVATSKQQQSDKLISTQKISASPPNNSSVKPGPWTTPSSVTEITTFTNFPGRENKLSAGNSHLQYTSVIGATILPGCNIQEEISTSVASTLPSVTAMTSLPASSISNTIGYSKASTNVDTKLDTFGTIANNDMSKSLGNLNKLNLIYPHIYDYQNLGNISQSSNLKQGQISTTKQMNSYQVQINVPNNSVIPEVIGGAGVLPSNKQTNMQVSKVQYISGSTFPLNQEQDAGLHSYKHQDSNFYHTQQLNHTIPDSSMNISTVRRNLPTSRPPSPVMYTAAKIIHPNKPAVQTGLKIVSAVDENEVPTITNDQVLASRGQKDLIQEFPNEYVEDEVLVDEDSEEMRPLRGILKQTAAKITQENSAAGKVYLRDSVELAHVQNDKKNNKKKSVRFASQHVEEDDNESDDIDHNEKWSFAGSTSNKNTVNRPLSAKFASITKPETSTRTQRAFSAGPHRQQPAISENLQTKNVQQISNNSTPMSTVENTASAYTRSHGERSNLPPSFVSPLNASPINRPKAAAHIIMSTDVHKDAFSGYNSTHPEPVTIHTSHLETKVRSANNNFSSKVPIKIPTSKESNVVVYTVGYAHDEGIANTSGIHSGKEDNANQILRELQQQDFDKSRNVYSKLVPSSNSGATQASSAPASTKSASSQSHGDMVSFSSRSGNAVYDETGVRIDRTPTDEEITWLWDKVRSCLNRESGNKSHTFENGNSDQVPRQPPMLSTKLIDGAALGFGTYKNGDTGSMNSGRPGVFYPRGVPTSVQNTLSPAVQQQGGYLRRYGLLKQRRASSASAIRNTSGSEGPKTGSVTYGRNSTIQPHQSPTATGQPQQREIPTPMAYSYKPQDEVSESTAAFLMAERLTKKSLSDSHIQMAMDDAHSKQEAYNRSKMTEGRNGPSNLSLEEKKLLESLDRLNERLKEPKFNGIIHYHQHNQAQLPAFQGHRPLVDSKRHNQMLSATQQRAQSARMRQNMYQYR